MILDDSDDLQRLDGCGIADAFRRFVLTHHSVVDARMQLQPTETNRAIFEEGQYPGPTIRFYWPALVTADEMAWEFVRRIAFSVESSTPRASPEQQQAAQALADRWAALIKLLQERVLIASGTYHLTGAMSEIDKMMWRRSNVAVDMQNGDLVEYMDHKPVVLWRGLSVALGVATGQQDILLSKRPAPRPHDEPALTAGEASIKAAVEALWPDGIPSGLPKQVRDAQINDWQKLHQSAVTSSKSIYRFLKGHGQ